MAGGEAEWEIVQLMPNLILPRASEVGNDGWPLPWPGGLTLGTSVAAIVPPDDERVVAICERSKAARALVEGCRDSADRPVRASLLITLKDAKLGMDALVDFRNAIAFTFLLKARARMAVSGVGSSVAWSETWDFFPAFITDKDRLVLDTPALTELYAEGTPFRAMPSPYVSASSERLFPDRYLGWALAKLWQGHYRRSDSGADGSFAERLFRSLQLGYQASIVPVKQRASLHEFGVQAALWVSAIEILAWPTRQEVSAKDVKALLGRVALPSQRERAGIGDNYQANDNSSESAAVRAYMWMYRVRSAFIHGNPVTSADLTRPVGDGRLNIHQMAAPVYRTALVAYLSGQTQRDTTEEEGWNLDAAEIMAQADYAGALDIALGDMVPDYRRFEES